MLSKARKPVDKPVHLSDVSSHPRVRMGLAWKPRMVLIVDDESDIRLLLRLILERKGMSVVEARDGMQALEMVERDKLKRISAVITDYLMPRMNGVQLCKELRRNYRHIKDVFLITAFLNEADKDSIKEFSRTFEKPLDIDTLVSAIEHRTTSILMPNSRL